MSLALIAGPIAVVDVETTGLFPFRHDRVVEVAVVIVRADGRIEREFVSLVNPARDIGPSSIHGLTSEDILHAPHFAEIAALVMDVLSGTVAIAAHNVRFDRQFLESEFSRLGCQLPDCFSICTMQLAGGGKLTDCCRDYGFSPRFRSFASFRQFNGQLFSPSGSNQSRAMSPDVAKQNCLLLYNAFSDEGMTTLCRTPATAQLLLTELCLIEPWKIVMWTTPKPMHWWKRLQDGA